MLKQFFAKKSLADSLTIKGKAQRLLAEWEYATCKGSELYQQKDYKTAILMFEQALKVAMVGLDNQQKQGQFMHYYTLASMNLAHALNTYKKQPQSERVLSDAHFNLLSLMVDQNKPSSFRQEARSQAEVLLNLLKKYLTSMGKTNVAESLEEEFYRLKVTSKLC
jgi:tetratricopeptide (TPR) repeat protein